LNKILFSIYFYSNNKNVRESFNKIYNELNLYYKFFWNYLLHGNKYVLYNYLDYLLYKYGNIYEKFEQNDLLNLKQDHLDFLYINTKDFYSYSNEYNINEVTGAKDLVQNINFIKDFINEKYESIYNSFFLFYPDKIDSFNIYFVKTYMNYFDLKSYNDFLKKFKSFDVHDYINFYGDYKKEKIKEEYLKIKYKKTLKKLYKNKLKELDDNKFKMPLIIKKQNKIIVFNKPKVISFGLTKYIKDVLNKSHLKKLSNNDKFLLLRHIIKSYKGNIAEKYSSDEVIRFEDYLRKVKHWEKFNYYIK